MTKKYQKELNTTPNDESDLTDYEENFIRTPVYGPYENDSLFDTYHGFEFFETEYIDKSIEEFNRFVIKKCKIPVNDYDKIEKGILAFTNSSTKIHRDSALLYKSLVKAYPDILLNKYNESDESIKQLVKENYFEALERFDSIKFTDDELIPGTSLRIYQKSAEAITLKKLKRWVEYCVLKDGDNAWAPKLERILIYRGINNKSYYKRIKNTKDFLSLYKSLDDDFPFFERNLLTSYTLSPNLAEQFMVGNPKDKSERRVFVEGHTEIIESRMFTSFLVSPNFRDAQYEIICLPDERKLKIRTDFDNEIHANYTIYN
ncbi:hypothetical protein FHS59_000407 [Algoriphagus iocasae]|uniref:Uncharacterized protein n=1 Tax=Algoriphagus iocasae TaxID=1836499 RepID=A0A841MA24_9BACT|nr:hypothetical protein [Algoriphagus iocasae]MBB6324792.1 hypothetical protein [Algoriphagus iocasae]